MYSIIPFLFTVISLISFSGCSVNSGPDVKSGWDPGADGSFVNLSAEQPAVTMLIRKGFPPDVKMKNAEIFATDCRGGNTPEIVIGSSDGFLIYSLGGDLLLKKSLARSGFFPSFMEDMDGDGKSDMVFGTKGADRNGVKVINGVGITVSEFKEGKGVHDFSSVIPVKTVNRKLYLIVQPEDVESPRGILCLDSFSLKIDFMFYTPYPVDLLFMSNYIIPSYRVSTEGVFTKYAREMDRRDREGWEARGMLFKIGLDGAPLGEFTLIDNHSLADGILRYVAVSGTEDRVLLVHSRTCGRYDLRIINTDTGEIADAGKDFPGRALWCRTISCGSGSIIPVLVEDSGMTHMAFFSSDLNFLKSIPLGSSVIRADLPYSAPSGFLIAVTTSEGIYAIGPDLLLSPVLKTEGIENSVCFTYRDKSFLALVKESGLELFSVGLP